MIKYNVRQLDYTDGLFSENVFNRFYDEYYDKVFNYMYFHIGHIENAEDLTAQVMERVLKNMCRYDSEKATLNTWIFRIAENAVVDFYRSRKRTESLCASNEDLDLSSEPCAEELTLEREMCRKVAMLLQDLSEREREIVVLKYWGGLKNTEIGQQIGIGASNVGTILQRTVKKLRGLAEKAGLEL